jgi:hypothetical protein
LKSGHGALALGTALMAAFGCSTTYQPRPSRHVGLVIARGNISYVKDGRPTSVGPLSGPLADLVAETPAAALHARTAHTQLAVGVPCYVGGLAGVVVGLLALSGPVGWVVIGTGGAVAGTGLGLMGSGFTHAVDAVNLHNDATDAPL